MVRPDVSLVIMGHNLLLMLCNRLYFKQNLIPVYHLAFNPEERRNGDINIQLSIVLTARHTLWMEALPSIRFAFKSVENLSTGFTSAYLMYERELRTPYEVGRDFRTIAKNENLIPEITPYLHRIAVTLELAREHHQLQQDRNKKYADIDYRGAPEYSLGTKVLVDVYILSEAQKCLTSKFAPRRDGPYQILKKVSPTSSHIASVENPTISPGFSSCLHPKALCRNSGREGS